MATVNSLLENEHVAHAVSLEQYKLGVVRRIIAQLNRSDASLAAALTEALERMPAESFTVERLELLLDEVRSINAQAYAQVPGALRPWVNNSLTRLRNRRRSTSGVRRLRRRA